MPHGFYQEPDIAIARVACRHGVDPESVFGLLTAVPMQTLCVTRFDRVTTFTTAGVTHPDPGVASDTRNHPAWDIWDDKYHLLYQWGNCRPGLLDAIITVTEAKSLALSRMEYGFAGTVTDAVIIASEGEGDEVCRKCHHSWKVYP